MKLPGPIQWHHLHARCRRYGGCWPVPTSPSVCLSSLPCTALSVCGECQAARSSWCRVGYTLIVPGWGALSSPGFSVLSARLTDLTVQQCVCGRWLATLDVLAIKLLRLMPGHWRQTLVVGLRGDVGRSTSSTLQTARLLMACLLGVCQYHYEVFSRFLRLALATSFDAAAGSKKNISPLLLLLPAAAKAVGSCSRTAVGLVQC